MRRTVLLVTAIAVLAAAAWWWKSHAALADAPSGTHPEADEQARARVERLRAQLAAASTTPLPAPRGDLEIGGQVIGRRGPVAGATVTATVPDPGEALPDLPCEPDSPPSQKLLDLSCEEIGRLASLVADRRGDAQPMARATTDAAGRFTLRGLAAGTYALWAEAPEGTGMRKGVTAGSSGDVLLGEGMRIRGKVVDGQGQPVEAAVVTAVFPDPSRFFDTLSAADGSFSLGLLPRAQYVVIAQSGTLLPAREMSPEGSRQRLLLTLHAPRQLRVRVLQDGAPAPGTSLTLYHHQRKQTAVTDQDGAFDFGPLEAGPGILSALRGNSLAETRVLVPERMDPPGVELHLEPGGRVECSVADTAGLPIPNAKVYLNGGRSSAPVPVAADGTCRTEGVPSGEYSLHASAKGFEQKEPGRLNVHPGETATARLVLERVASMEGTVLDPSGKPVAGAAVRAVDAPMSSDPTGDDGRFSLQGSGSGSVTLEASHDDYASTTVTVTPPAPGLVIQLTPGSSLDGVVLDASGTLVEGAQVQACEGRVDAKAWEAIRCEFLRSEMTDAVGAFHLRALPRGQLTLVATRDANGFAGQRVLKVLEGATPDQVTLQFSLAGHIAGTAVDEAGHPLRGVRVMVRSRQAGTEGSAIVADLGESDEAGAFEAPALDVGEYWIAGWMSGHQGSDVRARTGDEAVKLVLRSRPMVRGRVVTSSGEPVPVFRVNWSNFDDPGGQFAIERDDGSEMTLVVEAGADLAPETRHVPAGEGDYALGDVVVNAGRRLAGRVLDAETGLGVAGAMVVTGKDPGRQDLNMLVQRRAVATRPDGSFELAHVDDRAEALIAWRDGYEQTVLQVKGEAEVEVRLQRTGRIAGEVQWSGHSGLRVIANGVDTLGRGSALTDASGHFTINDLPAGTYSVEVINPPDDAAFFPMTVQVPGSREAHVTIAAQAAGAALRVRVRGGGPDERPAALLVKSLVKLPANRAELERAVTSSVMGIDTDGVLVFRQIPPGDYVALVALVVPKPAKVRLAMAPVVIGAQEQSIEIAVPADAPSFDLRAP